jgi:hypothetical protein
VAADDPREVAQNLMDPGHLLPGEADSESSPLLADAEHWHQVYAELLTFKRTLLRTAELHKDGAPAAVADEVSGDEVLLRAELERLERRHRLWQARMEELRAG